MKRALAIGLLAALAGCSSGRTEVVVVVTSEGLSVPEDVDGIHVQLYDANDPSPPLWDKSYNLCSDVLTSNCYTLPFTMTLIPGKGHPADSTRVVIAAQRGGMDRIDDAAIFTFVSGESERLDFVLYGNCLDKVDCAAVNKVCGPDRMCQPIKPTKFNGEPDLATGKPRDLGHGVADMHVPDMAGAPSDMAQDFAIPLDMVIPLDFTGCVPSCATNTCVFSCGTQCACSPGNVCQTGTCNPCGNQNDPCCAGHMCNGQLNCYPFSNPTTCDVADMAQSQTTLLQTWDVQTYNVSVHALPSTFNGVHGAGGAFFAVGPAGNIWHPSGVANQWIAVHSSGGADTANNFNRVWMNSSADAWAVGTNGTLDHWDGGSWTLQTIQDPLMHVSVTWQANYNMNGVWTDGSDVWISGSLSSGATANGMVIHKDNTSQWRWQGDTSAMNGIWSESSVAGTEALVASTEAQDFFAQEQPYDMGTAPVLTPIPYATGTSATSTKVWGTSISQAWFINGGGAGSILSYNGTLTRVYSNSGVVLKGISGSTAGGLDLWAVGQNMGGQAVLLHSSDGSTWTQQTNLPSLNPGSSFNDIFANGKRDVYIVGNNGSTGYIVHAHTP